MIDNDERTPGPFFDPQSGEITKVDNSPLRQMQQQAQERKITLINEGLQSGQIDPKLAELLQQITTSTTIPETANLHKIEAVLDLRSALKAEGIGEGKMAYIGSGIDWRFPVALGGRKIDMVDLGYEGMMTELMESVLKADPNARETTPGQVEFTIDVGRGMESVSLNVIQTDLEEYKPSDLKSVLEFAGPSKGYTHAPVLPNIAQALKESSILLNFDYRPPQNSSPLGDIGLEKHEVGGEAFYKVSNPNNFNKSSVQAASKEHKPPNPSLQAIRDALQKN